MILNINSKSFKGICYTSGLALYALTALAAFVIINSIISSSYIYIYI